MRLECKVTILFPDQSQEYTAVYDQSIYEFLVNNRLKVDAVHAPCGGRNLCGKCLIKASGKVSPMSNNERRLLGEKAQEGWRLACMTRIHGNITLHLDKPVSEDESNLAEQLRIAFPTVSPSEQPGIKASGEALGFAIDVGTATLAVYLYNLNEERLIGWNAIGNPQAQYASDIIGRIRYAGSSPGAQTRMRRVVLSALDGCMGHLLEQYSTRPKQVKRITIVGNPCMQHIIANVDITPLGRAPYQPLTKDALQFTGKNLGLKSAPDAIVELPGIISGWSGADTAASILTCGLYKSDTPVLLVDIGVNTALVLGNRNAILTCSLPTPPLDGVGLSCGCASVPGGINRIEKNKYKLLNSVINAKLPAGICGTGALDALGIMLRAGIIDKDGAILPPEQIRPSKSRMMKNLNGEWVFVISRRDGIYINQKDVYALRQARATIIAGINCLIKHAGIAPSDISAFYIAGGPNFECASKTLHALNIPPRQINKAPAFLQNAAGTGAGLILLNSRARADAEYIATYAQSLDIYNNPEYHEEYEKQLSFKLRKNDEIDGDNEY